MLLVPVGAEEDLDDDGGVVASAGEAEEDVAAARVLKDGLLGGLAVVAECIIVEALEALDVRALHLEVLEYPLPQLKLVLGEALLQAVAGIEEGTQRLLVVDPIVHR